MDYELRSIEGAKNLSATEKYIRTRVLQISGWFMSTYPEMRRYPERMSQIYAGSTVGAKLRKEHDRISYPSDKYIPASKRKALTTKDRMNILLKVEAILEEENYTVHRKIGAELGLGLSKYLMKLYTNPKYEEGIQSTETRKAAVYVRYEALCNALDMVATRALCGISDNMIAEFNELEAKEW